MKIDFKQKDQRELEFDIFGLKLHIKIDRYSNRHNGVIIFMPSAKSEKYTSLYPYFPRQKWSPMLGDYCVVYLSDPGDLLVRGISGGSWFFNRETSLLPVITNIIRDIFSNPTQRFFIYGSSMGGYGGMILGSLLKAKWVIAECPQIDLRKYKPFEPLVGTLLNPLILDSPWIDVFRFYREISFNEDMDIRLLYNIGDAAHIRYFSDAIRDPINKKFFSSLKKKSFQIELSNIHDGFGHVNFNMDQGVSYINRMISVA